MLRSTGRRYAQAVRTIAEVREMLKSGIDGDDSLLMLKPPRGGESKSAPDVQGVAEEAFVRGDAKM